MVLALSFTAASASARDKGGSGDVINYSWASSRIEGELWGLAQGNLDNDGSADTVLLERKRVRIGKIGEKGFEERFSCGWKEDAAAARAYLIDVDGDGKDEIAISAVEEGMPSSLVLAVDADAKKCSELVSRARWSIRAVALPAEGADTGPARRVLAGQAWSSQKYFSGPIVELALKKDKLVRQRDIELPHFTDLYQFTILPPENGAERVLRLAGYSAMELREHKGGGKWRKIWRSGDKLGGAANLLPAVQRPALDEVSSDYAYFDLPPLTLKQADGVHALAVKYDLPLRNVIGRTPYARGAETVMFKPDPALTYIEEKRTQDLPGPIMDYFIAAPADSAGKVRLYVLVQQDAGAFINSTEASILAFDLN